MVQDFIHQQKPGYPLVSSVLPILRTPYIIVSRQGSHHADLRNVSVRCSAAAWRMLVCMVLYIEVQFQNGIQFCMFRVILCRALVKSPRSMFLTHSSKTFETSVCFVTFWASLHFMPTFVLVAAGQCRRFGYTRKTLSAP